MDESDFDVPFSDSADEIFALIVDRAKILLVDGGDVFRSSRSPFGLQDFINALLKPRGGLSPRIAHITTIGLHPPALYSVGELKLKDFF